MTVNVTELSRGDILEIDGDPWQATEVSSQTPSARGAAMLVKAKLKNLRTGQTPREDLARRRDRGHGRGRDRAAQFLYRQGDDFVFMDLTSYEQMTLDAAHVGDAAGYLLENLELRTRAVPGPRDRPQPADDRRPAGRRTRRPRSRARPPRPSSSPPPWRRGSRCMVPSYIESGEKIRVDTRDGRFVERAK